MTIKVEKRQKGDKLPAKSTVREELIRRVDNAKSEVMRLDKLLNEIRVGISRLN